MSKNAQKRYDGRIETLKRRRDFLDKRIADYQGVDASRDKAEASALHWAIGVIEANFSSAMDLLVNEENSHTPPLHKDKPSKETI